MRELAVRELARRLSARLEGDGERRIQGVAPARGAGPGDLTFVADRRYAGSIAGGTSEAAV
ncbi:MAG: hypothetical protein ABEJ46_05900 [Gemmatimonadota bacterium]